MNGTLSDTEEDVYHPSSSSASTLSDYSEDEDVFSMPVEEDPVVRAAQCLGLDLYRYLAPGDDNVCLAPQGLLNVMLVAVAASAGSHEGKLMKGLYLEGIPFKQINRKNSAAYDHMSQFAPLSNVVLMKRGVSPSEDVLNYWRAWYNTKHLIMDFEKHPDACVNLLHTWIKQAAPNTLLSTIGHGFEPQPDTSVVLMNTIAFRPEWEIPFMFLGYPIFHLTETHSETTAMVSAVGQYPYTSTADCEVIAVPYVSGGYLVLFIPREVDGLAALEACLTQAFIRHTMTQLSATRDIHLVMPVFQMASALSLSDFFDQRGMDDRRVYMDTSEPYQVISDVVQKAVIDVGSPTARPPLTIHPVKRVVANRPFVYLVVDEEYEMYLLMGRCKNPKQSTRILRYDEKIKPE